MDHCVETLDGDTAPDIILTSSDNKSVSISRTALAQSSLLRTVTESCDTDTPVPVPLVDHRTLEKVVEYMEHHDANGPGPEILGPVTSSDFKNLLSPYDGAFVDVGLEELGKLQQAANYLGIASMMEIVMARVACMIFGKSTEEIRVLFGLTDDFTPDERARMDAEDAWLEK